MLLIIVVVIILIQCLSPAPKPGSNCFTYRHTSLPLFIAAIKCAFKTCTKQAHICPPTHIKELRKLDYPGKATNSQPCKQLSHQERGMSEPRSEPTTLDSYSCGDKHFRHCIIKQPNRYPFQNLLLNLCRSSKIRLHILKVIWFWLRFCV